MNEGEGDRIDKIFCLFLPPQIWGMVSLKSLMLMSTQGKNKGEI